MIKEIKTHFEGKKSLKTLFHNKKNTTMKKSTKNTFVFFKTLAWRTEIWNELVLQANLVSSGRSRIFQMRGC